ncbi:MAG: hypothetical protein HeimC2_28310 [Candidatus Heimdallarchaeota archaeon LC_2]|nr:MAG: hypothetical protein HeimC2_28310 [Candidatus Heimdallarchaeota archaeon LC_2]
MSNNTDSFWDNLFKSFIRLGEITAGAFVEDQLIKLSDNVFGREVTDTGIDLSYFQIKSSINSDYNAGREIMNRFRKLQREKDNNLLR